MTGDIEELASKTDAARMQTVEHETDSPSTAGRRSDDAVVVPGVGSSLTCVRSLGRNGVDPIVVSADDTIPSTRSKYCSEHELAPDPSEDLRGYTDVLLELAERPDVRTIVPLREYDIYVLAKYRDRFAAEIATPWPSFETLRTAQDRHRLIDIANDVGVSAPESEWLTEWDDWTEPRVIKPRHSIFVDEEQASVSEVEFTAPGTPPDIDTVISRMGHEPIVQEMIPDGGEYGFFALFDEGTPIATFQHRRVRSYKYCGGASVFRKSVQLEPLERAGLAMLEALDWHGPAMVEFKRDPRTGSFTLLEINPRFWGSLSLPVHAGVDFPYQYYQLAVGEHDLTHPKYDVGVGCHMLRGELVHLHSLFTEEYDHIERPPIARELWRTGRSLITDPNFDTLAVDDPKPFVREWLNMLPAPLKSLF